MERPSHQIASLQFHTGSRRIVGAGLSFLMPSLLGALLIVGLVGPIVKPIPPTTLLPTEKLPELRPPPPEPQILKPVLPTTAAPIFTVDTAPTGPAITTVVPQASVPPVTPPVTPPRVNMMPDRAASIIAATHTSPPYPPVARRLGVEGRVMLRLTIQPDGKVSQAEVVTSSGRRDFDEAAQSWIVAHWTYQPAIRDGAPATAQALAAVNFSLTNP
jgi:protein TonB